MAAAAIIGFNNGPPKICNIPIATGIPKILYPNAQNKFCLILRIVALLNLIAVETSIKSLLIKTISADSIATSVPLPIAIPTLACAKAGASLIPSPTMATKSPLA